MVFKKKSHQTFPVSDEKCLVFVCPFTQSSVFTVNSGALLLISVLVPGMQALSLRANISALPFFGKSQAQSHAEV